MRLLPLFVLLFAACSPSAYDSHFPAECESPSPDAPSECPTGQVYHCDESSEPGPVGFVCQDGVVYRQDLKPDQFCDCYTDEPVCAGVASARVETQCARACRDAEPIVFESPDAAEDFDPDSLCAE